MPSKETLTIHPEISVRNLEQFKKLPDINLTVELPQYPFPSRNTLVYVTPQTLGLKSRRGHFIFRYNFGLSQELAPNPSRLILPEQTLNPAEDRLKARFPAKLIRHRQAKTDIKSPGSYSIIFPGYTITEERAVQNKITSADGISYVQITPQVFTPQLESEYHLSQLG